MISSIILKASGKDICCSSFSNSELLLNTVVSKTKSSTVLRVERAADNLFFPSKVNGVVAITDISLF